MAEDRTQVDKLDGASARLDAQAAAGTAAMPGGAADGPSRSNSRRKRRRADGTLRPAVRRARARRNSSDPARQAWLANFAPGARREFFEATIEAGSVFLAEFARETGLIREEAAELLARTADERRWLKLVTLDGTCVGIAPPRSTRPSSRQKQAIRLLRASASASVDAGHSSTVLAFQEGEKIATTWEIDHAVEYVLAARGIQWVDHSSAYDLAVKGPDGRVFYFDVPGPAHPCG